MEYEKPWLSIDEQVDLLVGKGMLCDPSFLRDCLSAVGYYRLSAYWFPYKTKDREGNSCFYPETEFAFVWRTYEFDKKLRLLMFDAVGRIEIFIRSQMSYNASKINGPFDYPQQDIEQLKKEYRSAKRNELFIKHFESTYEDKHQLPPYWMMVETISMGTLESLYSHTDPSIKSAIANQFSVRVPVFKNWLSIIRVARNACCHHSRVWNRIWGVQPAIPNNWPVFEAETNRTFAVLSVLNFMLGKIEPANIWHREVEELLDEYEDIPIERMGFPSNWKEMPVWLQVQ